MTTSVSTATARAVFSPINRGGRVSAIADRLHDAIRLGLILDGDRLPSETILAAQFGVSPVTLRDALAHLRDLGLVETRRGRGGGTFVRAPAGTSIARLESTLAAFSPQELRDIGDHRRAIVGAAARLAALRALEPNLGDLREHLNRLRAATTTTERQRADARFHVEVAAAAQSPWLARAELDLWTQVGNLIWLPVADPDVADIVEEHSAILEAIANRDAGSAQARAELHVESETNRVLELRLGLGASRVH
jgi:GntR family transcriptional repressor for pyruvate dehydrogenase complex